MKWSIPFFSQSLKLLDGPIFINEGIHEWAYGLVIIGLNGPLINIVSISPIKQLASREESD